jgi:hypothetical protein
MGLTLQSRRSKMKRRRKFRRDALVSGGRNLWVAAKRIICIVATTELKCRAVKLPHPIAGRRNTNTANAQTQRNERTPSWNGDWYHSWRFHC